MLPQTPLPGAPLGTPADLAPSLPRWNAWWSALLCLALLLAWDASRLDLAVVRLFGTAEGFALRGAWVPAQLIHEGGRLLSALALVFLVLVNVWPRRVLPALSRRERGVWLAATVISLLAICAIKRVSTTSCPFDLAEFGGVAQYVSHWRFGIADGGPGHCFPSGHASSAFSFLVGGFILRRSYPRLARGWLLTVLALGLAYGVGQLVRGAHYPSHTMWTGWFCWMFALVAARCLPRSPA